MKKDMKRQVNAVIALIILLTGVIIWALIMTGKIGPLSHVSADSLTESEYLTDTIPDQTEIPAIPNPDNAENTDEEVLEVTEVTESTDVTEQTTCGCGCGSTDPNHSCETDPACQGIDTTCEQ